MTIRVILADDHGIMRDGLRAILEKEADIQVVAEAEDGRQSIQQCAASSPDVVVMDINMPLLNGIEAARQIRADDPGVQVVILSMHANKELIYQALSAGVKGYLLKATSSREVVSAIRAVQAGKRYLAETITETVIDEYVSQRAQKPPASPLAALSDRERQVFHFVVEGKSSAEIAEGLFLSVSTVNTYRSRLMKKLGVSDLPALVRFAVENRLVD